MKSKCTYFLACLSGNLHGNNTFRLCELINRSGKRASSSSYYAIQSYHCRAVGHCMSIGCVAGHEQASSLLFHCIVFIQ
jgi:hypothetical protein